MDVEHIAGADIRDIQKDPRKLWQPWIGNSFHLSLTDMFDLTLSQYIAMHDAKGGFAGDG